MTGKRKIVEVTLSIHVRKVRKAGVLSGAECVMLRAEDRFTERVRLIWRDTPFGGRRTYFQCPRCFKGAEILFYSATFLACRKCHELAYRSENLTPLWRKCEKLRKLQKRAGSDISRLPCIITKPRWMRWHSYLSLRRRIEIADQQFAAAHVQSRYGSKLRLGEVL